MKPKLSPDVQEVIDANKRGCKHSNLMLQTRWRGGRRGVIGGQRPVDVWYCLDCKEDVRDYTIADDPKFKKLTDRIDRGYAYLATIGKDWRSTLTPLEKARFQNAQADIGEQLKLFD